MDRCTSERKLVNCGIILRLRGLFLSPLNGIIVCRGRASLISCRPFLTGSGVDDRLNDRPGLCDVAADPLALRQELVNNTSEGLRDYSEPLSCDERVYDIHDCDFQPCFVAADFGSEEDAG